MTRRGPRRWPRALAWIASAALVAYPLLSGDLAPREHSLARVLLGPLAGAAASVQWTRAERAFREGRPEQGIERANLALELDPGSTAYWDLLGRQQALHFGSLEREPAAARRLAWLRSGLSTLERGEASARDPAQLALSRGLILLAKHELDPELPYPGGPAAILADALRALEHARALGSRDAAELLDALAPARRP